jgi:hypothetical protein
LTSGLETIFPAIIIFLLALPHIWCTTFRNRGYLLSTPLNLPEGCPTYLPPGTFGVFVVYGLPAGTRLLFPELPGRSVLGNEVSGIRSRKPLFSRLRVPFFGFGGPDEQRGVLR